MVRPEQRMRKATDEPARDIAASVSQGGAGAENEHEECCQDGRNGAVSLAATAARSERPVFPLELALDYFARSLSGSVAAEA